MDELKMAHQIMDTIEKLILISNEMHRKLETKEEIEKYFTVIIVTFGMINIHRDYFYTAKKEISSFVPADVLAKLEELFKENERVLREIQKKVGKENGFGVFDN